MKRTRRPAPSLSLPARIIALPRTTRVAVISLFAFATTILLSPLVDGIYLERFYNPATVLVPALVTVGIGVAAYVLGWVFLVGFGDEEPSGGITLLLYLMFGIIICIMVIVLVVIGAVIGSQQ